jgi:hypothetical protein
LSPPRLWWRPSHTPRGSSWHACSASRRPRDPWLGPHPWDGGEEGAQRVVSGDPSRALGFRIHCVASLRVPQASHSH